jgi:integrase
MGVKIRVSRGKLFLDIYWQGVRKWENLHLSLPADKQTAKETMRLADIIRAKREQQLVAGEFGLQDIIAGKQGLVEYATKLASTQNKKNPLPKSVRYLKQYAGTVTLGGVTATWLDGYRSFLLKQDALGGATASKYLSVLKGVIHQAIRDRLIIRDPCESVKGIKVPEAMTQHLTFSEIERLAKTPIGGDLGAEVKKAFLFACFTGLRVSDLRGLKWGNIERDPMALRMVQQKTKTIVKIPMAVTAWAIIDDKKIHHADEKVFPKLTTGTNTNVYLIAWAERARIEKQLGWHVARRSFGTLALQNGSDLATVSRLLGHTSLKHTQKYLKTDTGTMQRAIDSLPEIDLQKRDEIIPIRKVEGGEA